MGYFEIGIYRGKHTENVGTLWRSAYQLGAAGIFTIGSAYKRQPADTAQTMQQIPLRQFATFEEFLAARPFGAVLVGIEMGGTPLSQFCHPDKALYLLGSEIDGLPPKLLAQCNHVIALESVRSASYNVAVTGSIVMYHRVYLSAKL
jgi:tRNA G18 (ribose-2'-O)-methylase SpoU